MFCIFILSVRMFCAFQLPDGPKYHIAAANLRTSGHATGQFTLTLYPIKFAALVKAAMASSVEKKSSATGTSCI